MVSDPTSAQGRANFQTTLWNLVLEAGEGGSPDANAALEKLCRLYWHPIYVYIRRHGHGPHDAQDLTQEFFARLLRRKSLGSVSPHKGRFRSFLLASLKNFLADARDAASARKRGGDYVILSLDCEAPREEAQIESTPGESPDAAYDRRWVLTLLEEALATLRKEHALANKAGQFDRLKGFLSNRAEEGDYEAAARELEMTSGAVAVAVHRLRQRYRDLVRAEIARTVNSAQEMDEELRHLFGRQQ